MFSKSSISTLLQQLFHFMFPVFPVLSIFGACFQKDFSIFHSWPDLSSFEHIKTKQNLNFCGFYSYGIYSKTKQDIQTGKKKTLIQIWLWAFLHLKCPYDITYNMFLFHIHIKNLQQMFQIDIPHFIEYFPIPASSISLGFKLKLASVSSPEKPQHAAQPLTIQRRKGH